MKQSKFHVTYAIFEKETNYEVWQTHAEKFIGHVSHRQVFSEGKIKQIHCSSKFAVAEFSMAELQKMRLLSWKRMKYV